jgi:hypothetical protein
MNELLQSIKVDLTSRRLAPLLVLAAVALLGACAYAALGGGGSPKPPAQVAAAPVPSGLPVSIAPPSATAAAAETPGGAHYQTHDPARDPFLPLPGSSTGTGASSSAGSASSGGSTGANRSAGSTSSGGGSASGPSTPAPAPAPAPSHSKAAPKATLKPVPLATFSVSVLFGMAPATPEQQPTLTPYEDLKRFEPIPSAKVPLLVFLGVLKTGDKAMFAFTAPPILRGPATCYPSATHCQAIALAAGQSEELEYVKRSGEAVTFELKVVKISRRSTPTGAARALRQSKAGRRALLRAGLWTLP